jgi:hypothetical protein
MKRVTLRRALTDRGLLGSILAGDSWLPWRAILLASMGEELDADERVAFQSLTGRLTEPLERVEELWAVVGRRGGKTRSAATLAVYLAALCDHRKHLAAGERGLVLLLAQNTKAAAVAFNYCVGIFDSVPLLRELVTNRTSDTLSLSTGVDLEIRAASFKGLRSVTAVAVIADEVCFWPNDEAANADTEILNAVRPALATTGGPLICISSPYAKRGAVFDAYRRHYGPTGDLKILVARGASRDFNASLPQSVVDRALERDAASARAEYLAEFRNDLEIFISRELVEAAVDRDVLVRPPIPNLRYHAFADPSGGAHDSFTLAVAHREDDIAILDCLVERRPPFNAQEVVRDLAKTLREGYGLTTCVGDRYAAGWVQQSFAANGVTYLHSARDRSQIYADCLPLFTSGKVRLLDNKRLINQIVSLERRTSSPRDKIDHPAHGSDDAANSACASLVLAADRRNDVPKGYGMVVTAPRASFGTFDYAAQIDSAGAACLQIPRGVNPSRRFDHPGG